MKLLAMLAVSMLCLGGLAGCEEGGFEEAGEEIDEAVDETGDEMEELGDDIEDETEEIGDEIEDATDPD
jgi:hypothetical protein